MSFKIGDIVEILEIQDHKNLIGCTGIIVELSPMDRYCTVAFDFNMDGWGNKSNRWGYDTKNLRLKANSFLKSKRRQGFLCSK